MTNGLIAYVTDVEGSWDKLASFATDNPHVTLDGTRLVLADGVTFVFGGDAIDRGPNGRRVIATLLEAKRAYGDRVVLLAGNRDINKLRLVREIPSSGDRGAKLRWILANTMGASRAFDFRAAELGNAPDDVVVDSYLADLDEGGDLRAYLAACVLSHRAGATLFLHGGVTPENYRYIPDGGAHARDPDDWVARLNRFFAEEIATFSRGDEPTRLIAYQAPLPGTPANQASVVYGRPTDDLGNPRLPPPELVADLRRHGIERVVVGHTPSGDCPAILRDAGFELVLGDNSYGRIESGSQLAFDDGTTYVRATTQLDDGGRIAIDHASARDAALPLGLRDAATGQLVKAALADGGYLMFRGLPERKVEQLAATADDVAQRRLRAR